MQVAAKLAEIASGALTDVQRRLEQLEKDLHPHTSRMLEVAAALEAEPSLAPAPAAQRATEELHTLAGSGPVAMEAAAAEKEAVLPGEEATAENTTDGPEDAAEGSAAGRAAVEAAKSQLGAPYVWGGTGPGGFDCSGLTSWAYKQAGVDLPRMAHEQAIGTQVSYDQLQPGDLAVWDGHVAMYAGDGMYIEAGDPVQMNPVRTSNIGMPFKGFWRPTG